MTMTTPDETFTTGASAAPTKRLIGAVLLALIFCTSALATVAYFSDVPAARASSQPASAADAAPAANAPDPFAGIALDAQAAYVQDLTTGTVLYQLHPGAQLPLASLTKIPMALAVSQVLSPEQSVRLPRNLNAADGTATLLGGQTWHLKDVMDFTLVTSSNDGAVYLSSLADAPLHARYPESPAADTTLWRMNQLVQELGLHDTYFLNVNGLDVSTTQSGGYGSARSVARLMAYAASTSPAVFGATTHDDIALTAVDGSVVDAPNTDKALSAIPGMVMGKTGYTDLAGGNLAVVFDAGLTHPVVLVVLGSGYETRFDDMTTLVAAAQKAVAQGR